MPELAGEVASCGLTLNQARIYLYLLFTGPKPATSISKSLGLHRVDVYRRLHELQDSGLLETSMDSPKKNMVLSPDKAAATLIRRQEEKLAKLKQRSHEVFGKLASVRESLSTGFKLPAEYFREGSYRLVVGRKRYYDVAKELARNSRTEILRVSSPGGLSRTFLSGLDREYAKAKSRGVTIRIISAANSENRQYALRLSRIARVKYMETIHLRFTIIDRSVCVVNGRFEDTAGYLESPKDQAVVFENPALSDAFHFLFEDMWKSAKSTPLRLSQS